MLVDWSVLFELFCAKEQFIIIQSLHSSCVVVSNEERITISNASF